MIRSVICSVFLHRFFVNMEKPKVAHCVFLCYLVTLLAFDVFLCFDIFFANGVGITCDGHKTWQIYTLISVDTMQCILLITVSILMYRKLI